MIFVGVDQSLTACGLCIIDEQGQVITARTIRTGKLRGMWRVQAIIESVRKAIPTTRALAVMEGAAHGAPGRDALTRLSGVIEWELWHMGVPVCDYAPPPTTLAKYITGSGGGTSAEKKRRMIEAARAAGVDLLDDNAADAWGLARLLWDAWRGVRGGTLHQEQTLDKLRPWIEEQAKKGEAV